MSPMQILMRFFPKKSEIFGISVESDHKLYIGAKDIDRLNTKEVENISQVIESNIYTCHKKVIANTQFKVSVIPRSSVRYYSNGEYGSVLLNHAIFPNIFHSWGM